ncbi:MAG: hypothetical protein CMC76_11975 [Flavobacteriaceae bacterium]|nr:hypothetical protein [Flavobacteriaceae bacterium]|tara:strand:- start:761 stop:1063 length:303 start_codon:yes stop_codon:yes gene_type:complete
MNVTITYHVTKLSCTVTYNGVSINTQPVIQSSGGGGNGEVRINGIWYYTVGNTDVNAIEDGNEFRGLVSPTRYVVGVVLDATDFDIDDPTKARLLIDNRQ